MKRDARRLGKRIGIGVLGLLALLLVLGVRCDRPAAEIEARWALPPSQFIELAGGLRVHYRDRQPAPGAPTLVLLHGSNASLFTWEGWVTELGDAYRIITLDLPGHGLTGPDPRERYSPGDMAEAVDLFVTALGVSRFSLGGNSMGGNVAWHYALAHRDKLDALILVDSAGLPREEPRPLGFRIYATPGLSWLARWITPRFMVGRSVRDTYGDPSRVSDALVDQYDDMLLREDNRAATRMRFALPDDGMSARLAELELPTLILWGDADRWILPRYGERFHAAIAGSRLVTFAGLGHIPMEEDPTTTASAVRAFMDEQPR